jgi:Baseplate J-like protein
MSASLTPTVASVPGVTETATGMLSLIAALTSVNADINKGSQVRTLAESIGAVAEEEGIAGQALALQALAYGAMNLFGISQAQATAATGIATFATSLPVSAAPVVPQAVAIPSGTLMQTGGGIQFATIANATLASGTSSVPVGIMATTAGSVGNVGSGAIASTPLTPLGYPLYVTNLAPTQGGIDAGTQSQALALFTAKAASLGLSSPVAIADAVIGVVSSGTGETVQFSSVYEPWISAGSGAGSGTAGFTLYVDNGTGTSSPSLIAAALAWITGNQTLGESGYRPAGVPFTVSGASPVYCSAAVSGILLPGLLSTGAVVTTVIASVESYFNSIGIASGVGAGPQTTITAAYQPQVAAVAADAGAGAFASLSVNLYYSGSSTPVPLVSGGIGTRVILESLSVQIGSA